MIKYIKVKNSQGEIIENKVPIGIDNSNNPDVADTVTAEEIDALFKK